MADKTGHGQVEIFLTTPSSSLALLLEWGEAVPAVYSCPYEWLSGQGKLD